MSTRSKSALLASTACIGTMQDQLLERKFRLQDEVEEIDVLLLFLDFQKSLLDVADGEDCVVVFVRSLQELGLDLDDLTPSTVVDRLPGAYRRICELLDEETGLRVEFCVLTGTESGDSLKAYVRVS